MQNYYVEEKSIADMMIDFPYTPSDVEQSVQDWLESKLAAGYSLVGTVPGGSGSTLRYIFRVVAK